ncbi:hypothetical protein DAVIS_04150 [Mycobacterium marinum]|uniref:Uncharacterized protein n=1 Tax=Mycobacterium marinum TaxID=1781 RepID=A0A3E2MRQ6_MYCMR|nr:hypothetical protein DAVIS_04150 [Mycobacterium marinum]
MDQRAAFAATSAEHRNDRRRRGPVSGHPSRCGSGISGGAASRDVRQPSSVFVAGWGWAGRSAGRQRPGHMDRRAAWSRWGSGRYRGPRGLGGDGSHRSAGRPTADRHPQRSSGILGGALIWRGGTGPRRRGDDATSTDRGTGVGGKRRRYPIAGESGGGRDRAGQHVARYVPGPAVSARSRRRASGRLPRRDLLGPCRTRWRRVVGGAAGRARARTRHHSSPRRHRPRRALQAAGAGIRQR